MKFVASMDIGDLGPKYGEATTYQWKLHYSIPSLMLWVILLGVIVLPKSNRNGNVLYILISLVIVKISWEILLKFANMNYGDAIEFGLIFDSIVVGVTVLWLTAMSLIKYKGHIRFLLSFVIMLIVGAINLLSYSIDLSREFLAFMTFFFFIALTMLTAIALSRRFCRGEYRPVRFMLWLALWVIVCSMLNIFGFIVVMSIIFSSWPEFSAQAIFAFALATLVICLFLYLLNLPYMILGFVNSFFRERFCACLNLKSKPAIIDCDPDEEVLNKQSDGSDMTENDVF